MVFPYIGAATESVTIRIPSISFGGMVTIDVVWEDPWPGIGLDGFSTVTKFIITDLPTFCQGPYGGIEDPFGVVPHTVQSNKVAIPFGRCSIDRSDHV